MPDARPQIACEIAADRVLAGRVSVSGQISKSNAARELAPGTVVPDLTSRTFASRKRCARLAASSQRSRGAFKRRDRSSARRGGPCHALGLRHLASECARGRRCGAVPAQESLPLTLRQAKVSYVSAASEGDGRARGGCRGYDQGFGRIRSGFSRRGLHPGVVVPSMIAAMGAAQASRPTLVVKVDARSTSIAIMDQEQLLLFRTLENMRGVTITGEQLAEDVYPFRCIFPGHVPPQY